MLSQSMQTLYQYPLHPRCQCCGQIRAINLRNFRGSAGLVTMVIAANHDNIEIGGVGDSTRVVLAYFTRFNLRNFLRQQ